MSTHVTWNNAFSFAADCQENETALDIQLNLQEKEERFERLEVDVDVRGPQTKRARENQDPFDETRISFNGVYNDFDDAPSAVSMCIPNTNEECLTVLVRLRARVLLPPPYIDRYDIVPDSNMTVLYGGEPVSVEGPFGYTLGGTYFVDVSYAAAKIGKCDLECDSETESLFGLETATINSDVYDWKIIDSKTGKTVFACPRDDDIEQNCYWHSFNYYNDKFCLPKDGCYVLVAGGSGMQGIGKRKQPTILNVHYDGDQIAQIENLQYEAIDLGSESCPKPCDDETESLLEIFVQRKTSRVETFPNITWSLSPLETEEAFSTGVITFKPTLLEYHRECIPKIGVDSCIRFELSSPDGHDDSGSYRLVLDGTIFGTTQGYDYEDAVIQYAGEYPAYRLNQENNYTIVRYVGNGCSSVSSDMCNPGESTMDFAFKTAADAPETVFAGWWLYTYQGSNFRWIVHTGGSVGLIPGETYRLLACFEIPDDSCTEFGVLIDNLESGDIADYELMVNGTVFDEWKSCESEFCDGLVVTRIGGDCPDSTGSDGLSKGAVAGISAAVAAVALFMWIVWWLNPKRRSHQDACDDTQDHPSSSKSNNEAAAQQDASVEMSSTGKETEPASYEDA